MKFPYKLSHRSPRGQNDSGFARITRRIRRACEKYALRNQLPGELSAARQDRFEFQELQRVAAVMARGYSDLALRPDPVETLLVPVRGLRTVPVVNKTTGQRRLIVAAL